MLRFRRLPAAASSTPKPLSVTLRPALFVPYTAEAFDARGEFDVVTHTFTAAETGDYLICASLRRPTPAAFELDIFKNGAREKGLAYGTPAATGCRVVRLAPGDQIQIKTLGPAATFANDLTADWLEVARLH